MRMPTMIEMTTQDDALIENCSAHDETLELGGKKWQVVQVDVDYRRSSGYADGAVTCRIKLMEVMEVDWPQEVLRHERLL